MTSSLDNQKQMKTALKWSLGIHLALLIFAASYRHHRPLTLLPPEPAYVFNVQPQTPGHFVDALVPTNESVAPTDLIAEQNSKAQDLSDVTGKRPAPYFENPSDFDQLAGAPVAPPPSLAETPKPPAPTVPPIPASVRQTPPPAQSPSTGPAPAAPSSALKPETPTKPEQSGAPQTTTPFDLASAPAAALPGLPAGEAHGRVDGGVVNKGFTAFEAAESELAPYMKEIRSRVERNWRVALQLKYTGTQPTKAVLDCAITPDGQIAYVNIIEAGNSPTYAPICKEAVEKAGPFSPFPFKVPDIYRSKNLEIRWTFSFLQENRSERAGQ